MQKTLKTILVVSFCVFAVAGGGSYVWARSFNGKIAPRVSLGGIDVSGMDPEQARQVVQARIDSLLTDGMPMYLEGSPMARLPLSTVNGPDIADDVVFDLDGALLAAQTRGHSEQPVVDTILLLNQLVRAERIDIPLTINTNNVSASVLAAFPNRETPAEDAHFTIEATDEAKTTWNVQAVEGADGIEFDFEPFFAQLHEHISSLSTDSLSIELVQTKPSVSFADARKAENIAESALNGEVHQITYTPEGASEQSWTLTDEQLSGMLVPTASQHARLSVADEPFEAFVATIAEDIEVPAQNARFSMENGRVKEFVGSRNGLAIDREALKLALSEALSMVQSGIALDVIVSEPEITTDEVNDLGITEALGVGTSDFSGSPGNRIKNIRNGVRLLNGLLIAPDEEFSLLNALAPFTYENGYLAELVIKGDEIKPEIGGGLCQIGTTTFRATMMSGLPVLQRQNHSLVVRYYNDPQNGNPGTDATIYDPAPDYKFKNDTGHYILFEAEMLEESQELRFTFWGTSDGRKGSYSPPVVTRWIGVGEPVEIETTDLAPGERDCQGYHVGADASFVYTIEQPDGQKEETTFESHYRPLPTICLVGVEELSTQESLQDPEDNVSSDETPLDGPLQED